MGDVTVDEVVDTLVKEIENEMEYTIGNVQSDSEDGDYMYQLPLQDIGNETMDLIIRHNTAANGFSIKVENDSKTSALDLGDDNTNTDRSTVREYSLADYDVSIGSINSLMTNPYQAEEEAEIPALPPMINLKQEKGPELEQESGVYETKSITSEEKYKPLSTIVGLGYENNKSVDNLVESKNVEDFNDTSIININERFDLPKIIYQEPIVMTTLFEEDTDTVIAAALDPKKNGNPSNYLSIWHFQEGTKKVVSPTFSAHSRFSDGTNVTAVDSNSNYGSVSEIVANTANFKFKPRAVSRSKVYYPNSRNSSGTDSGRETIVSSNDNNRYIQTARMVSLGNSTAYSSGNFEYMSSIIDTTVDTNKLDPLDFTFTTNENLSNLKVNESMNKTPDISIIEETEHDIDNLEQTLSTIIDFDKSDVLSKQLERELGVEFGVFLNEIDDGLINDDDLVDYDTISEISNHRVLVGNITDGYEDSICEISSDMFEHFSNVVDLQTTSPKLNEDIHIRSPFKVVSPTKEVIPITRKSFQDVKIAKFKVPENRTSKTLPETVALNSVEDVEEINEVSVVEIEPVKQSELLDRGNLYLTIDQLKNVNLECIKSHNAKFSVEYKIGETVKQTPYEPLSKEGKLSINENVVSLLDNTFKEKSKLEIKLKCQYDRLQNDLVEVIEKIPIVNKNPFRKTKYVYKTKFVQRAVSNDRWDNLFGDDGSCGLGSIELDTTFLENVKFNKKSINIPLINKWNKDHPTSEIGKFDITACHIPKSSLMESLPTTLLKAEKIVKKYEIQQNIFKEGFLLQEGGDLQGKIQRRFFILEGNTLTGYHDTTRKAQLTINLLNVKYVLGYGEIPAGNDRNFSNFTNLILLGDCIQLVFENDEVISLSVETSENEKKDWYMKLNEVVQLNVAHQPWVKKFTHYEQLNK